MLADPLSDVLSLLKPDTYVSGGLDLGGDWSIQYDPHSGIKCYAIVSGSAWLRVEGGDEPLLLEAGDCVLLPGGRRFVLAKDLAFAPVPFSEIPRRDWLNGFAKVNGGGDAKVLAGHFAFSGSHVDMLLGAMPSIMRLRDESDKVGLRWALKRLQEELTSAQPGGILVAQHLSHLMLIQALRLYLLQGAARNVGWLFALADYQLSLAIGAMHAQPGARWTLPVLAEKAGMSRSKFAQRFKAVTGSSPIEYLTHWRMIVACDRLSTKTEPVSVIAAALGYESESAFSTAFRRKKGCSPRKYATQRNAVPAKSDR